MDFESILALKKVCNLFTEQYVIDTNEKNKKLKDEIIKLKYQSEKPKNIFNYHHNTPKCKGLKCIDKKCIDIHKNSHIWHNLFDKELILLIGSFVDYYDNLNELQGIWIDTNFFQIQECFINNFSIISNNYAWSHRICIQYLDPVAITLNRLRKIDDIGIYLKLLLEDIRGYIYCNEMV